jgi:hypothetical protein
LPLGQYRSFASFLACASHFARRRSSAASSQVVAIAAVSKTVGFGKACALVRNVMLRITVHEDTKLFSKRERRRFVGAFVAAALLILAASLTSKGAELSPETMETWDAYVKAQNDRVAAYSNGAPFLWSDESPDRLRHLHNGETVVAPFGKNPHRVPQGLIHHWVGVVFLPGACLDNVLSVVRDYGRYKDFYAPNVIESTLLRRTDTDDTFSLRMLNKAVVAKFALDTEFQDTYTRVNENKFYSVSYSTRVREVENLGLADEHEAPANTGRGLIWRLYSISRFEQRDGGVYIELEAVALSRDVPSALRWFADPIVRRTSRSSMVVSLQKTQGAVLVTTRAAKNNQNDGPLAKSALSNKLSPAQVENGLMP